MEIEIMTFRLAEGTDLEGWLEADRLAQWEESGREGAVRRTTARDDAGQWCVITLRRDRPGAGPEAGAATTEPGGAEPEPGGAEPGGAEPGGGETEAGAAHRALLDLIDTSSLQVARYRALA